ncbi:MAG TPA: hypothetical protein ENH27_01920 [Rhizobiales bacterium]|nr:hypothetical protein [Hyphomicrobiales bacterium]
MLTVEKPAGGMQLIAGLPDGAGDTAIVSALARRGVLARPLSGFYLGGEKGRGLLLGFAGYAPGEIEKGLAELRKVLPA